MKKLLKNPEIQTMAYKNIATNQWKPFWKAGISVPWNTKKQQQIYMYLAFITIH